VNDRCGNGTGGFEVKVRMDTSKFTNMTIAGFRDSRDSVRESEMIVKDEAEVMS